MPEFSPILRPAAISDSVWFSFWIPCACTPLRHTDIIRAVVIDGVVAGIWRRAKRGKQVELSVEPARKLTAQERRELDDEAERIGPALDELFGYLDRRGTQARDGAPGSADLPGAIESFAPAVGPK